jgi:hypothetical protein
MAPDVATGNAGRPIGLMIADRLLAPLRAQPARAFAIAMIRDPTERRRSGYPRSFSTMYALLVPLMVFIASSAPQLVPLMCGDQRQASIAPGQVAALTAIFLVDARDHALYAGIGLPSLWTLYAV